MKLAQAVKPISYVKAHMAEIIERMAEDGQPIVITQNGEAKAVLLSVGEWDQMLNEMAQAKASLAR